MRCTLNFNASATLLTQGATKVRTKVVDGVLMIKPTDRVEGKNLPKGEKLLKLSRRSKNTVKFSVRGFNDAEALVSGVRMGLTEAKHGWFILNIIKRGMDNAAWISVVRS